MSYQKSNPNGQAPMADSQPVVIASDQTAIPIADSLGNPIIATGGYLDINIATEGFSSTLAQESTLSGFLVQDGDALGSQFGAVMAGSDGTNFQFIKTDASGELQVDVLSSTLPTGAATSASQTTGNTALAAIQTSVEIIDDALRSEDAAITGGTRGVLNVSQRQDSPTTDTSTDGDAAFVKSDAQGRLWVNGSGATQPTTLLSTTTGGYTPGKLISAASTNATNIKASAGTIGYITASNINASPRYLKIYNKATSPTVGTDTPIHTFLIPGNASGAGTNIPIPAQGIACTLGIGIAITTGAADADTGAVAASDIIINYGTK